MAKASFDYRAAGLACKNMEPEQAEKHYLKLVKKHGDDFGDAKDEFLFGYYNDKGDNYPYKDLPAIYLDS